MSIQNVSSIGKASFQGNFKKTTEVKTAPNKIKDDKKKLALTLGGLATLGLVSAGIIYGIKTGKFGKAQQETQEQGQKIVEKSKELTKEQSEKIKGLIEGQKIPYTNNNKLAGRTTDKFYATFNGQDVIVEHKIKAVPHKGLGNYAFIRDRQTGELVTIKRIDLDGSELPFLDLRKSKGVYRTTEISVDTLGCRVRKTFKNGKLYATQTISPMPDGEKLIMINYEFGKTSSNVIPEITPEGIKRPIGQTQILIMPDGTRKVFKEAKSIFEM